MLPSAQEELNEKTPSSKFWLITIFALGLLMRLIVAYVQPAFLDEGFVYYATKLPFSDSLEVLKIDAHPPLYNALMSPLIAATSNIFILRLPSLVCSLATILLSFSLFRRFFEERESLNLTAFISFSYAILLSDIELRTYAPLMMMSTAIWLGMLDIHACGSPFASRLKSPWGWLLFIATSTIAASLHYLGVLTLFSCGISALFLKGSARWRTALSLIVSVIPVTAWYIYSHLATTFVHDPIPTGLTYERFASVFEIPLCLLNLDPNLLKPLYNDSLLSSIISQTVPYIVSSLSLLAWVSFAWGWRKLAQTRAWESALLGINLLLPHLLLLAMCVSGKLSYTQTRYAIPMTAPFIILLYWGLGSSSRRQLQNGALALAISLCLLFPFCPFMWNQCWQKTLDYVDSVRQPRDIIAIFTPYAAYSFAMAYDPDNISFELHPGHIMGMKQDPSSPKFPTFLLDSKMIGDDLLRDLQGYRLIVIMCQEYTDSNLPEVMAWFDRHYRLVGKHNFTSAKSWGNINTYVLERVPER